MLTAQVSLDIVVIKKMFLLHMWLSKAYRTHLALSHQS